MAAKAFAFLRAEDFRRLASIKCFHSAGGAKCLRAGVKAACAEIAPYASPPQLTLALRGYELCGNQISRRFSAHGYIMTSTPSTRRLFDGVAVPVPQ